VAVCQTEKSEELLSFQRSIDHEQYVIEFPRLAEPRKRHLPLHLRETDGRTARSISHGSDGNQSFVKRWLVRGEFLKLVPAESTLQDGSGSVDDRPAIP